MIYFVGVLGLVYAKCPRFECKKEGWEFSEGVCAYYADESYFVNNCKGDGLECKFLKGMNSSCVQTEKTPGLPGEQCKHSTDCYGAGVCVDFKCRGIQFAAPCDSDMDCEVGLYCSSSNLCMFQSNAEPCTSDFSCENFSGCNNTEGLLGNCAGYFNITEYEYVAKCENNRSQLCSNGYCVPYVEGNRCFGEAINTNPSPYICENECQSLPDINLDYLSVFGSCECGLNGNQVKVCSLFYQDAEARRYFSLWYDWVTGNYVKFCHTLARGSWKCMKEYWEHYEEFVYRYYSVNLYPYVYMTESCVLEVLLPEYWNARIEYEEESLGDCFLFLFLYLCV